MSDLADDYQSLPTGALARLRHTPLRDLVRGRVTGRLDWRGAIARAGLPAPIAALVTRVVQRTRLWRGERVAVADELIAHFRDGLAAGTDPDAMIRAFGDERPAAKLIRLAKRRNRPLAWHALKWTRRSLAILILVYAILFIRFRSGHATVAVDYVAVLNAPILATPESDRAWPIYKQAVPALELGYTFDPAAKQYVLAAPHLDDLRDDAHGARLFDALPGDPAWPALTAWLEAHQQGMDLVRAAANKPALGFVLGEGGDAYDPTITGHAPIPPSAGPRSIIESSTISVLLPYLNIMRKMCVMTAADLRVARTRHDAARVEADLDAMLGIARQTRDRVTVIDQLVSIACTRMAFDSVDETLAQSPDLFDDATLIRLAHTIGTLGGNAASGFLDYSGEQLFERDIIQRLYTDDGNGDGRLTGDAPQNLSAITSMSLNSTRWQQRIATAMVFTGLTSFNTRRAVEDELDRWLTAAQLRLQRPMYEQPGLEQDPDAAVNARMRQINESTLETARLMPVTILTPAFGRSQFVAERLIGHRDGVVIGLALELYRRRHDGQYPATLDALVPDLLPHVPADRITGQPVHYRLIDGKPVVYSVGVDRDDDGGRAAPKSGDTSTSDDDAASIGNDARGTPTPDGDWILYDGRGGQGIRSTTTTPARAPNDPD